MYKCVVLVSDTTIMHPIDKFLYMGKAIIGAMDNFQLLMDKTNRYGFLKAGLIFCGRGLYNVRFCRRRLR